MEVRRNDAKVARDRCLEAMIDCADEETRRSLWKAAIRYHGRLRDEARQAVEAAAPLTQTRELGSFGSRVSH